MAAVTGAVIGGISMAGGAYQAIKGAKQARDAQNALNDLPIPELQNAYEGMQVSQLGANLQREEGARQFATGVDALRSGGIRGIIGGLGQMSEQQNLQNRQIAANLDEQQKQIRMAQAEDDARIRAMKEQRYQGDVSALSSQVSAGQASQMQGIKGAMQGLASGAQMYQQQANFNTMYGNKNASKDTSGYTMTTNPNATTNVNPMYQSPASDRYASVPQSGYGNDFRFGNTGAFGPQQPPGWYNSLTGIDYNQFKF